MKLSVLLCALALLSATTLRGDAWSPTEAMQIEGESGPEKVFRQTLLLNADSGTSIDLIYTPTTNAAWIGVSQGCYFRCAGSIWSVSEGGRSIVLRRGSEGAPPNGLAAWAESWLKDFYAGKSDGPNSDRSWVRLYRPVEIFGAGTIYGDRRRSSNEPGFGIERVHPTPTGVTLLLKPINGHLLELAFDQTIELLSSSVDGLVTPALKGSINSGSWTARWSERSVTVETANGPITARAFDRSFTAGITNIPGIGPATTAAVPYAPVVRVLVMPSGQTWIGPSFCRIATVGNRIIGATVNRMTGELLVFRDSGNNISMHDIRRRQEFERLILEIEGRGADKLVKPDLALQIADLFPGGNQIAIDPDMRVTEMSPKADRFEVRITHTSGVLEIELTQELSVVTSRLQ